MYAENDQTIHQPAALGTILKVAHVPISPEGDLNTQIHLKGHPLFATYRDPSLHHTTEPELAWHAETCIYCQQCHMACPRGCLHQTEETLEINREACTTCGTCVKECPSMALEIIGKRTTAADLLHKIFKQNYAISRKIKQVTLTGGEPGMQTGFCADLLFQLSATGVPTTLETTGAVAFTRYLPLLLYPDIVRFELVAIDPALHQRITGYENQTILENLQAIAAEIPPQARLVIRTPLIRNQTATQENLQAIGTWLKTHLSSLPEWECFEPEICCEDDLPLNSDEWQAIRSWVERDYPAERIAILSSA